MNTSLLRDIISISGSIKVVIALIFSRLQISSKKSIYPGESTLGAIIFLSAKCRAGAYSELSVA